MTADQTPSSKRDRNRDSPEHPVPWTSATQFMFAIGASVIGLSNLGGMSVGVVSFEEL